MSQYRAKGDSTCSTCDITICTINGEDERTNYILNIDSLWSISKEFSIFLPVKVRSYVISISFHWNVAATAARASVYKWSNKQRTTVNTRHIAGVSVRSCISPEPKRIAFLYLKVTRLHSKGDIYSCRDRVKYHIHLSASGFVRRHTYQRLLDRLKDRQRV